MDLKLLELRLGPSVDGIGVRKWVDVEEETLEEE